MKKLCHVSICQLCQYFNHRGKYSPSNIFRGFWGQIYCGHTLNPRNFASISEYIVLALTLVLDRFLAFALFFLKITLNLSWNFYLIFEVCLDPSLDLNLCGLCFTFIMIFLFNWDFLFYVYIRHQLWCWP